MTAVAALLLATMLAADGAPQAAPQRTAGTASVRGRVTSTDGRPLRGARVILTNTAFAIPRVVATDDEGRFEFTEVSAGTFTVIGSKIGYVATEYGQRRFTEPGTRVRVAEGAVVGSIDIFLPRTAAISGRVTDENGDPIEGATVSMYTVHYVDGRRQLAQGGGVRTTNDAGRYRLFNLAPGDYVVSAAVASTGPYRLPGYTATYFPGSPNVAEAQFITIAPGDDVPGIDIHLVPGRTMKLSGTALGSDGRGYQGLVTLKASQRTGAATPIPTTARSEKDGRFEFLNVPPGDYVAKVFAIGTNGVEFASQFVTLRDADVSGVTLHLANGSAASGRMVFEGAPSDALPREFRVDFVPSDPDVSPEGAPYSARLRDDWSFDKQGLYGPLLLRASGAGEWMLRSVRVNGEDVTDTPLSYGRRGETIDDIEVVMTNRGAEVIGLVADSRGQPVTAYTAIVFSTTVSRWTPASRFVKAQRAESDGAFTIRGLPSGEYYVAAVNRVQMNEGSGEWQDPVFLEQLTPHAVKTVLTEGQSTAVTLRLTLR